MSFLGAFRGNPEFGEVSHRTCDSCGLLYELRFQMMGFPNIAGPGVFERKRRLRKDFEDKKNRCTCDPHGDAEFLRLLDVIEV